MSSQTQTHVNRPDPDQPGVPRAVNCAAYALLLYGAVVLVNATVLQVQNEWAGVSEYPRAVIRAVGMGLLWLGLRRRVVAAWWVAVILAGLWAITPILAGIAIARIGVTAADLGGLVIVSLLGILLLLTAVVLLCLPSSRAAFRRRAL